jgi:serine/threonine protein kinase/tetratricopeptide (TPR) repeat protein
VNDRRTPPSIMPDEPQSSLATFAAQSPGLSAGLEGCVAGGLAGYELLQEVGRGGMGVVFLARDVRLDREVAVKLLREESPGAAAAARQRFLAEAKITARLEHPGIPSVHEVGEDASGRPFLAMKLVRGRTLAEILEASSAKGGGELGRHLAAFEQICQAVGYAHSQSVIHRDLKPSNVMVGEFGEVQVMDWGLAKKAIDKNRSASETAPLSEESVEDFDPLDTLSPSGGSLAETPAGVGTPTQTGAVLGTPAYMAPEQAAGRIREVDARSDVFGLGAILFHILAGRPPYLGGNVHEVRQRAAAADLGEAHSLMDGLLSAGEADPEVVRLCKRCLEAKPIDRPANGAQVAAEVTRIRAEAQQRALRAEREKSEALLRESEGGKRRRVMLLAASIVGIALAIGAGAAWLGKIEATEAAIQEQAAKRQALQRAKQIEQGRDLLASIFDGLDIRKVKEGSDPLEAVLGRKLVQASKRLEKESLGDPLVVADLQDLLGRTLMSLGHAKDALKLFEKSLHTRTRLQGPNHLQTLTAMGNLAEGHHAAGDLETALPLAEKTHRAMRRYSGKESPSTIVAMGNLAAIYQDAGRYADSLALNRETLTLTVKVFGAKSPDALVSMNNLANALQANHEIDEAIDVFERTIALMDEVQGPDHPDTIAAVNSLAATYQTAGRGERSLPLLEKAFQTSRSALGADHPQTLICMNNLAQEYAASGRSAEALELLKKAYELLLDKHGADHPDTLAGMNNLAGAYLARGELQRAVAMLEQCLKSSKSKLGAEHLSTLKCMNHLGVAYHQAGQTQKAVSLQQESLKLCRQTLRSDHPQTAMAEANLATGLMQMGRAGEALPLLEAALPKLRALHGADHPDTLNAINSLASAYQSLLRHDEALPLFEEAYRQTRDKLGAGHPQTLILLNNLAGAYGAARQSDKALPLFEDAYAKLKETSGPNDQQTLNSMSNVASAYRDAGRLTEALPMFEELVERSRASLGPMHPDTISSIYSLAEAHRAGGDLEKALPLYEQAIAGLETHRYQLRYASLILLNYVAAQDEAGRYAEAESCLRQWLSRVERGPARNTPEHSAVLQELGQNLVRQEKWTEAETSLRECLKLREGPDPRGWHTFRAKSLLGAALVGQTRYDEAETLLEESFEGLRQTASFVPMPMRRMQLAAAADRLISLYDAAGKKAEADRARAAKEETLSASSP